MTAKTCNLCLVPKEESCFYLSRSGKYTRLSSECKDCRLRIDMEARKIKKLSRYGVSDESQIKSKQEENRLYKKKMYRLKNPHSNKLKKYGLSLQQYNEMLSDQNNACAICLQKETLIPKGCTLPQSLSIDHDHKNGKVRGLLCYACNLAIGLLKDSPDIAKRASTYLIQ